MTRDRRWQARQLPDHMVSGLGTRLLFHTEGGPERTNPQQLFAFGSDRRVDLTHGGKPSAPSCPHLKKPVGDVSSRRWEQIHQFAESLAGEKARQIIGKAGLRPSDLEDVRQQLLMYVVMHLDEYDRRRGPPEAHVTMLITTAVAMLLRVRRTLKRCGGRTPVSLDAEADGQQPLVGYLSPADCGRRLGIRPRSEWDAMEISVDLADALSSMPTDLHALVRLLAQGETVASVARLTGRSRRQVYYEVEAISAHLSAFGLDER